MSNFRCVLQKYSGIASRFRCPNCGKREFVRYIDLQTGNHIAEHVGKCNRIEKCGYHFTPKHYFESTGKKFSYFSDSVLKSIEKPTNYFDENLLLESLHSKEKTSHLFHFFCKYFEPKKVEETFNNYLVGVSEHWEKSVVFWQVDPNKKVRAGKIMQYHPETGRRDKDKFSWIKKSSEDSEMRQVFFGVHLLEYFQTFKIGIVESEKTALLCDLFLDEKILWLASGGLQGLTENKFKDLTGRKVILFPDLSAKDSKNPAMAIWKNKAENIGEKLKIDIQINSFLEQFAGEKEKENQEDLGDFILKSIVLKEEE